MRARLWKLAQDLVDAFWVLPAVMVVLGIAAGLGAVEADRRDLVPSWFAEGWLYGGGSDGARSLLGAVASSTVGVAGTVFSITVAALTLASNQMGPRLLRNFMRDRGNQATLGVFLGTFAYALVVLRTVRGSGEGDFVPHLALTLGTLLAFACVGTLVYFVHHVAPRINVDTVVDLVHADLGRAIAALTGDAPGPERPPAAACRGAAPVAGERGGYLQQLDGDGLADWAEEAIRPLEVLTAVARRERRPERLAALRRHAGLALADGRRAVPNPADRAVLARRHARFLAVVRDGPLAGTDALPPR